jgi:hydrogenase maturation protease
MKSVLVIGYGNTLRTDDGLGPLIVDRLGRTEPTEGVDLRRLILPQLDIMLAPQFRSAAAVIFVDARQDDDPRPVRIERIAPPDGQPQAGHTGHALRIPALLRIAADWYGLVPCCYLAAVKGFDFSIGDKVSDRGLQSAECAVDAVRQIIRHIIRDRSAGSGQAMAGSI